MFPLNSNVKKSLFLEVKIGRQLIGQNLGKDLKSQENVKIQINNEDINFQMNQIMAPVFK